MSEEKQELDPETRLVLEALREKGITNTIPCAQALAVADELGIKRLAMGDALNRLKIKIHGCQLGCFGRRGESQ